MKLQQNSSNSKLSFISHALCNSERSTSHCPSTYKLQAEYTRRVDRSAYEALTSLLGCTIILFHEIKGILPYSISKQTLRIIHWQFPEWARHHLQLGSVAVRLIACPVAIYNAPL